MLQEKQPRHL